MAGPDWDWLHEEGKQIFVTTVFTLTNNNNRMGYRFNNAPLQKNNAAELISSAVDVGTIQLLPDGNTIVLMADAQTTGGYPRIASVLKTALPKLAQLQTGESITYKIVSLHQAEQALLQYNLVKQQIKESCLQNFKKYFSA
jgi:antagonist of KipI